MDQEACPVCSNQYVVFRDITGARWRYLCACESDRRCQKGRHPATHAKLHADDSVDRYACDDHGVPVEDRPPVPVLVPKPPSRTLQQQPQERVRRKVVEVKPKVRHDILTLDGFKASLVEEKLRGRCRRCHRERALIDSAFRPVGGTPLFDLVCPSCGYDRHDFI